LNETTHETVTKWRKVPDSRVYLKILKLNNSSSDF
jgi:hypothetical protein